MMQWIRNNYLVRFVYSKMPVFLRKDYVHYLRTKKLIKKNSAAVVPVVMAEEGRCFVERLSSPEAAEALGAFFEGRPADFSRFC